MDKKLPKIIIITGANGAIGKYLNSCFQQHGQTVFAINEKNNGEKIEKVYGFFSCSNPNLKTENNPLDFENIIFSYSEVVLINCIGQISDYKSTLEFDRNSFIESLASNLLAPLAYARYFEKFMEKAGSGHIINFAGGGAAYPYIGFVPYALSKTALVRATETLAEELKNKNIRSNIIAPGATQSKILDTVLSNGGFVKTLTEKHEIFSKINSLIFDKSFENVNGRFIHVRDDKNGDDYSKNKDLHTLRRIE